MTARPRRNERSRQPAGGGEVERRRPPARAALGARRAVVALLAVTAAACFSGSFNLGEPCLDKSDCGPSLECVDGLCGGSPGVTDATSTTDDDATPATSDMSSGPGTDTDTIDPTCGDGQLDEGEDCDDGNLEDTDACPATCQSMFCGDGVIGADEECDGDYNCTDCLLDRVVYSVAAGGEHTCGRVSDPAGVRCWGSNANGQLGYATIATDDPDDDKIGDDEAPWQVYDGLENGGEVPIGAGEVVVALVAGQSHTCVRVGGAGEVRCWGSNSEGQLGYGVGGDWVGDDETPAEYYEGLPGGGAVPLFPEGEAPQNISALAAGAHHTCALLEGGTVRCWGSNERGQLGYGPGVTQIGLSDTPAAAYAGLAGGGDVPVLIPGIDDGRVIRAIAAGRHHTCAVLAGPGASDYQVRCWGENSRGQLGYGINEGAALRVGDDETPAQFYEETLAGAGDVPLLADGEVLMPIEIGVGERHSCALVRRLVEVPPADPEGVATPRYLGFVRCWGSNDHGQLGYPINALPQDTLPGTEDVIGDDETPRAFYDQVFSGVADVQIISAPASDPWSVSQLAVGWLHTCALLGRESGERRVQCWGYGRRGQLGYGEERDIGAESKTPAQYYAALEEFSWDRPVEVLLGPVGGAVTAISAGRFHTCALLNAQRARCWGFGEDGRLGYGVAGEPDIGDDERPETFYLAHAEGGVGDVPIF
ncbi:MAG: hypothetical protein R3A51_11620 [Nannocystaceae bacterium]